jgi:AcrR family transcriptional regulator
MTLRGRRPGSTETRDAILSAARSLFAERGYGSTTIRAIAAEAGVNPALVHHFFGSKEKVFVAALDFPFNPADVLQTLLDGPREDLGRRIMTFFLGVWRDPESRSRLLALIRSATTNEQAAAMFRQFIDNVLLKRVGAALDVPKLRLTAGVAQMLGVALLRYVIQVEPLASARDEEIVALVAPVLQRYIDGM